MSEFHAPMRRGEGTTLTTNRRRCALLRGKGEGGGGNRWNGAGNTPRASARSALDAHWRNRPDCRRSLYYVGGLILMSSDVKRPRVIVNLPGRSEPSRRRLHQRIESADVRAE